jgi:hypothetical protein
MEDFAAVTPPFDTLNADAENTLTPSSASGEITLTALKDVFSPDLTGAFVRISQQMEAKTVTQYNGTSASVLCKGWKIITHGTWSGTVTIQSGEDDVVFRDLRKYTSSSDFNPSETGDFDDYTYVRLVVSLSSGSCTADLTALPYTHEGFARIISADDPLHATALVIKPFGSADATADWNLSCWSDKSGYPASATFFQDRLVFAGSKKDPGRIWLSRTGDYTNFAVEKSGGQVLDDSSIQLAALSREMFAIEHIIGAQDLLVLTEGNEWIISGQETVTPKTASVKLQSTRGSSNAEPQYIGNRLIYVQAQGGTVRDMGYSFESDSYAGSDLTLLAKHLVRDREILDAAYAQEPDSVIYFVRSDGVLLCLTYLQEQKV